MRTLLVATFILLLHSYSNCQSTTTNVDSMFLIWKSDNLDRIMDGLKLVSKSPNIILPNIESNGYRHLDETLYTSRIKVPHGNYAAIRLREVKVIKPIQSTEPVKK